jgi:hypothetical protein
MNNKTRMSLTIIVCGLAISVGPGVGGYFIGKAIERFKTHDRTVVVKGLSEREVKSDLAVWNLTFKASGNDLVALDHKMVTSKEAVMEFLKTQGFDGGEIKPGTANVTDKLARDWGDQKDIQNRYILEDSVSIRSTKVDLVKKTTGEMGELIKKEIIVSGDPSYYYTKFSELRPEMIGEATRSARQAAIQFANDSGARVGYIRSANQGAFSISGKDNYGDQNDYNEIRSLEKKIRVVSTVTFSLEQ